MKPTWQNALIHSIKTIHELCDFLELDYNALNKQFHVSPNFPVRVPVDFAMCMKKGDVKDPLLLQVLPRIEETVFHAEFIKDPVGDLKSTTKSGLIHKYKNRVLMTVSGNCAVHCRYCFRQYFPYSETQFSSEKLADMCAYIKTHSEVTELILSGGDPLSVSDKQIAYICHEISLLEQIKTVRFHTRFPVVIPSRITPEFIDVLASLSKNKVMVLHINHPNEISRDLEKGVRLLKSVGCTILNQAVLLKGVNDSVDTLTHLSERLFDVGILPYYLNQLDKVEGASHFEVPIERGKLLINELRARLSGYLVPRYIQEISGETNKTVIL